MPAFHHATLALLHGDEHFSWTVWDIHPSVLIGCSVFAGLYLLAIGPWRSRFSDSAPAEPWRVTSFLTGTVLMFLVLNGPLHDLSDNFLFSAHMVQHLVLTLIVAPLWLLGLPRWLLAPLARNRAAAALTRFSTGPLIAFGIYNVVFIAWHIPAMYNFALEHHSAHIVQHLMFIGAAVLMWWPALNPLPELRNLTSPVRLLYLFALGIPMSVISALITLSDSVLYTFYSLQPRVFESLSALDDQQLGGLIMWVPGTLVYWIAISVIFFKWANREEKEQEVVFRVEARV